MNTNIQSGIIVVIMPPGGWHFPQLLSSGQTVRLEGFSYEDLVKTMLEFRLRHLDLCGSEKANPEGVHEDLKAYLCKNFPQNCADRSTSPPVTGHIGKPDYKRPIDRSGAWLAELGNTRVERVDYALAGSRAQICVQCPQNVRWATPCAPCNDNILVKVQQFKGSLNTLLDRRLFMCRVYGHINEVAIWLTDTHSSSEQPPPAHCWKVQNHG